MGHSHEAQGGSALHPRPGPLRRRHQAARHAVPGHRAQPVRARQDHDDRHRRSAQGPRRAGGDHRRDARAIQPALDADADVGHPDGAAGREGDVPGAGGGGGRRHRSLHRGRRRRGGRGRLRAAAGGGRSVQGARARRAGAAHRQEGQEGQPHLPLGGRRPRGDRQGLRRGRRHGQAGHLPPAHPRRLDRDLRLRRRLRPGRPASSRST